MVFSSPTFLFIFLPVVFLLQLALRRSIKASNIMLLVVSLLFYAWGEPLYVLLMLLTTFVNYICALGMANERRKRLMAALAIVWNIGSLVVFKYTVFLLGSVNGVLGTNLPLPEIALPIGISFFTFQAMSYTLDVYRGDARLNKSYFDILLYISLFPQLIAGPIVKYHDVDEQIRARTMTLQKTAEGFRRFSFGLAKKVLIANTLAYAADAVFALPSAQIAAPSAWLGAIAYLMQIYFDFSGYSDMAIGLGKMFGFDFKENFLYPYAASSMQDFWRRWHISLSTWFKLYVYIPLGGNRKGKLRTGLNKIIVFLLTGLWHGASWSFALWGLFHGFFLMLESSVLNVKKWPKVISRVYVLLAVTIGFVLFRADTITQAADIVAAMFVGWNISLEQAAIFSRLLPPIVLLALPAAALAAAPLANRYGALLSAKSRAWETAIYCAALLLLALSALCLSTSAYNPFIYFRF